MRILIFIVFCFGNSLLAQLDKVDPGRYDKTLEPFWIDEYEVTEDSWEYGHIKFNWNYRNMIEKRIIPFSKKVIEDLKKKDIDSFVERIDNIHISVLVDVVDEKARMKFKEERNYVKKHIKSKRIAVHYLFTDEEFQSKLKQGKYKYIISRSNATKEWAKYYVQFVEVDKIKIYDDVYNKFYTIGIVIDRDKALKASIISTGKDGFNDRGQNTLDYLE